MEENRSKKALFKSCVLYALASYAALSFLWVCVVAIGMNNANVGISVFARRLVVSDLAIALFSAVFGCSFLVFRAKKLSPQVKRLIHIVVNYFAAMLCVYALFSNVNDVRVSTWIVFMVLASAVYFIIYGVAALVVYLIKRKTV